MAQNWFFEVIPLNAFKQKTKQKTNKPKQKTLK